MPKTALPIAREQLEYWRRQYSRACEDGNEERVYECQLVIEQTLKIIDALEYAAQHIPARES